MKSLEYSYDSLNRIVRENDHGIKQVVNYTYDNAGNKIGMSLLNDSRKVQYSYGKINELVKVIDPEKGITTYSYDADGREIKKVMPNNVITETQYDPAGRITELESYKNDKHNRHDKDDALKSYAYLYNAAGERTYQIDEDGNITAYQYDELGRVKNVLYPFNSNKKTEDFKERLYLGLYPECEKNRHDKDDCDFDLPKINDPDYINNDFENSLTNILAGKSDFFNVYKKFDKRDHHEWKVKNGQDGTDFITKLNLDSNTLSLLTNEYKDIGEDNHFKQTQYVWTESFTYDANANINTKANGWGKIDYAFDKANELLSSGNRNYSYDLNGNLVKESLDDINANYQYNMENRVVDIYSEIEGFICHNEWKLVGGVSYEYDAFGRRSESADYDKKDFNNKEWKKETSQSYLYDGLSMKILGEFWDTDFKDHDRDDRRFGEWKTNNDRYNPVDEYIYGNGKLIERTDFVKSDRWFDERFSKCNDKIYYSQDILGSTILLTNQQGNAIQEYNYDVYGNNFDGTFLKRNEIGFNGKIFDPEVKLYDYRFRDYSPVMMRFTTVDPIRASFNWYVFCKNDPVNFIDPFGLSCSGFWSTAWNNFQSNLSFIISATGTTLTNVVNGIKSFYTPNRGTDLEQATGATGATLDLLGYESAGKALDVMSFGISTFNLSLLYDNPNATLDEEILGTIDWINSGIGIFSPEYTLGSMYFMGIGQGIYNFGYYWADMNEYYDNNPEALYSYFGYWDPESDF